MMAGRRVFMGSISGSCRAAAVFGGDTGLPGVQMHGPTRLLPLPQPPFHPPFRQHPLHILHHEMPRAVLVITLRQEIVVFREHVPHIGDQRQPGSGLGRGGREPTAVERVVDDRAELMARDARRKPAQRLLDLVACWHYTPCCIFFRTRARLRHLLKIRRRLRWENCTYRPHWLSKTTKISAHW